MLVCFLFGCLNLFERVVGFNHLKSTTGRLRNLLDFYFVRKDECFQSLDVHWRSLSLSFTLVIIQHFFLCREAYYFHNNPKKFD